MTMCGSGGVKPGEGWGGGGVGGGGRVATCWALILTWKSHLVCATSADYKIY